MDFDARDVAAPKAHGLCDARLIGLRQSALKQDVGGIALHLERSVAAVEGRIVRVHCFCGKGDLQVQELRVSADGPFGLLAHGATAASAICHFPNSAFSAATASSHAAPTKPSRPSRASSDSDFF